MDILTLNEFLSALIVFFFCLLGVITKDYMDTISGKDTRVYYFRIVIIAVIITILMLSIKDTLLLVVNKYLFAFLCIAVGWSNYAVYQLMTDIGNAIIKFFRKKTTDDIGLEDDKIDKIMDLLEDIAKTNKSEETDKRTTIGVPDVPHKSSGANIPDAKNTNNGASTNNTNIDDGGSAE